jgi:hypothetical protein
MMGKYLNLEQDVFSIFGSPEWLAEDIRTYPSNFVATKIEDEFLRVSILPSGGGVNLRSVSGMMIVEIYIPSGRGTKRLNEIADTLDSYLEGNTKNRVQMSSSALSIIGEDKDNPSLFRANYSIPFNYYGVM